MKNFRKILTIILAVSPVILLAGPPDNPPNGPIGGGVFYLLLAGIGFGLYTLKKRRVER